MLTFDAEAHKYYWSGVETPSVTQIINEWIELNSIYVNRYTSRVVAKDVFNHGRDRGQDVHSMIYYALRNELIIDALSPDLKLTLAAFREWHDIYKPEIIYLEKPMYSEKFGYAGTVDLVCRIDKREVIVDWKSGMYDMAGIQLAGYEQLLKEKWRKWKSIPRYVLHLPQGKRNGKWKFVRMDGRFDWDIFKTMLALKNMLERAKLK